MTRSLTTLLLLLLLVVIAVSFTYTSQHSSRYRTGHRWKQIFCYHRQLPTKTADPTGSTGIYFSCRAKDCGTTWTTNHNKAAVRVCLFVWLVSQSITAYVSSHVTWQLSVTTPVVASGTPPCRGQL